MSAEVADNPIFFFDVFGMPCEPPDAIIAAGKAKGVTFIRRPDLDPENDTPGARAYVMSKETVH